MVIFKDKWIEERFNDDMYILGTCIMSFIKKLLSKMASIAY